jgi:hypothetical protein
VFSIWLNGPQPSASWGSASWRGLYSPTHLPCPALPWGWGQSEIFPGAVSTMWLLGV